MRFGSTTKVKQYGDGWIKITLDAEGVQKYLDTNQGMMICSYLGGVKDFYNYKLYIDEFAIVKPIERLPVKEVHKDLLTADAGTVHGAYNSVSAKYTNGYWDQWSYIWVDDNSFKDRINRYDTVEFWAYLTGGQTTVEQVSLAVVTENSETLIKQDVVLEKDGWTQIRLTPEEVASYMDSADGMRLRLTASGSQVATRGGTDYTLYLDEFRVISNGNYDEAAVMGLYKCTNAGTLQGTFEADYDRVLGTKISISGAAITKYIEKQDGLRFRLTVNGGSNMTYTINFEDFSVIQPGNLVKGSLNTVEIHTASSSDKILQIEDCSNLGTEFVLYAYRNEYESGQLILSSDREVSGFTVSATDFTCGDSVLSAEQFELYTEYYHEIEKIYDSESEQRPGMYPDALIPMETAAEFGLNQIGAGENQGIWIAVKIPSTQTAGTYEGSFRITLGSQTKCVSAQIVVADYTLPDTVSLQSCIPIQKGYIEAAELDDSAETYFTAYLKAYIDVSIENSTDLFAKAYVYMGNICDEPSGGLSDERAQYCAQQFQSAVTEAAAYLEAKSADSSFKERLMQSLRSLQNVVTADKRDTLSEVNTYCPMIDAFDSDAQMSTRKAEGNYWWYTCTQPKIPYPTYHIDDEAASARIMGWLAKESGVRGYLTWERISEH